MFRRARPVVLFVDQGPWLAFLELAGALRRAGVRTVCVLPAARPSRVVLGRLCYGTTMSLDRGRGIRRLERLVRTGRVLDVQLNELCVRGIAPGSPGRTLLDEAFGSPVGSRLQLADKLEVSERLAAGGVCVPQFALLDGDHDDAGAALGWPVVVKRRISCGGAGMRIARDGASLAAAIDALSAGPGVGEPRPLVFAERFVEGEVVQYNAVAGRDGVEQEVCTHVEKSTVNPLGPALRCVIIDDPVLRDVGRKALEVLGCTGIVQLEFIRAADGTLYHTDLNPRAFANISALAEAGVDLIAGYLHWLSVTGPPPETPVRIGSELGAFPQTLYEQRRATGRLRASRRGLRELRRRRSECGSRYAVTAALLLAQGALKAAWRGKRG